MNCLCVYLAGRMSFVLGEGVSGVQLAGGRGAVGQPFYGAGGLHYFFVEAPENRRQVDRVIGVDGDIVIDAACAQDE